MKGDVAQPEKRRNTVPAIFTFRLSPELKEALGLRADEEGLPLNEWMAAVLAEHIGRPELAKIPRKSMGRPRKAVVTNGAPA